MIVPKIITNKYINLLYILSKQNKVEFRFINIINIYANTNNNLDYDIYFYGFWFYIQFSSSDFNEFSKVYSPININYYKFLFILNKSRKFIRKIKKMQNDQKFKIYNDTINKIYERNNINLRSSKIKKLL